MATIDFRVTRPPAEVNTHVAADAPARFLQPLQECRETPLSFRIFCGEVHEDADAAHFLSLLRSHHDRPRRSAAEQRDELAAPHHSITSSARASSLSGIWRPSVLAVLRLITRSNLVGCWMGSSPGFSPLSTRPA